ncbi:MAG: transposase [Gammaproteobacteria bacterium]|nr:transposase [Gammaproteobacteria bacterium]
MPRPLRIEYENAYYHVMNRGTGRRAIFHGDEYYGVFLQILGEVHRRFGVQIHSYCLMRNHYHLLVKTPEGNLGRAMRHINGVYTQRHNRLRKTDGPLFRGRYKAILVEEDSYQLQVSRYIHCNPLKAKSVESLDRYQWSSYPAYLGDKPAPTWLYRDEVYGQLGVKRKLKEKYRAFVEQGVDEELTAFYGKGNQRPYLGSDEFRAWVYQQRITADEEVNQKILQQFRPDFDQVIKHILDEFSVDMSDIMGRQRGRREENIPRWVVMYLGQELCGLRLRQIADSLGLKRTGSIPTTIGKLRRRMEKDKSLVYQVEKIKSQYCI